MKTFDFTTENEQQELRETLQDIHDMLVEMQTTLLSMYAGTKQ